MTEQHDTPSPTSGWRGRAGAIARSLAAVAAGIAVGYSSRDVGLGITTTGASLSLLREAFIRPPQ